MAEIATLPEFVTRIPVHVRWCAAVAATDEEMEAAVAETASR